MKNKNMLVTGYSSKIFLDLYTIYLYKKDINLYFVGRTKPMFPYKKWIDVDFQDLSDFEKKISDKHLPDKFDYLFLNHGVLNGITIEKYNLNSIYNTVCINYISYLFLLNQLYNKLLDNCSIVITSSISAKNGSYDDIYSSTKMGLEGLINSVSKKLHNSRINCVAPGIISDAKMTLNRNDLNVLKSKIELTPLKKFAKSMDVAASINFLLFEESAHITGQVLHVNGGL